MSLSTVLVTMSSAAPVSLSGIKSGTRPMHQLRRCISSHSASSEYVVAAGEPPLDRYLESHLPGVRPTAAAADPWQAFDSTHPLRGEPTLPSLHTLERILPPSLLMSQLLHTTPVQQTVPPYPDMLLRPAMLPRLPPMPATIVLPLMMYSFSSSP